MRRNIFPIDAYGVTERIAATLGADVAEYGQVRSCGRGTAAVGIRSHESIKR